MAVMMTVVVILFFISAVLSLYTRQCGGGNEQQTQQVIDPHGLNHEIIQTFPSFLYATVKPLMIQRDNLACAVCLDDFRDDDTLRFIPKCSHVFHVTCIDVWLLSHSTCPVCRANLVIITDDLTPFVSIQIPDDDEEEESHEYLNNGGVIDEVDESRKNGERLRRSRTVNEKATARSRSTGFLLGVLFRRCNTTGHDDGIEVAWERFTLRLPEEVRRELVMNCCSRRRMKRARSCVNFRRSMSSGRISRTRSVGSGLGSNYNYERLHHYFHA